MNSRSASVMFSVILLMIGGVIVYQTLSRRGLNLSGDGLFPSLKAAGIKSEDISTIEIERKAPKAEKMVFVKDETTKTWRMTQPNEVRVVSRYLADLARELVDLRKAPVSGDITPNLSQFGLSDPEVVIHFKAGVDKTWTLKLGNTTPGSASSSLVYVTTSEKSKVPTAVQRNSLSSLFKSDPADTLKTTAEMTRTATDFRYSRVFGDGDSALMANDFQMLDIKSGDKEMRLTRGDAGSWKFEKPAGFGDADIEGDPNAPFSDDRPATGVNRLLNALGGMSINLSDYVDNPDATKTGLDPANKELLRITATFKPSSGFGNFGNVSPITDTLLIGNKADERGDKVYCKWENEPTVFMIPPNNLGMIRKSLEQPSAMRDRSLGQLSRDLVDAIDLKIGDEPKLELRKVSGPAAGDPKAWFIIESNGTRTQANKSAIENLMTSLSERRLVRDFPPAGKTDAELGFDKPSLDIAFWQEAVKEEQEQTKDEKGETKPASGPAKIVVSGSPKMRLIFGKKDKDIVYVRRMIGETKTDVALPENLLGKLTKREMDLMDSVLPSFTTDTANKIIFNRGKEIFELNREKKESGEFHWKIVRPAELAGKFADKNKVNAILDSLSTLRAEKLFTKKGSDEELGRWGLKPPAVEATITVGEGNDAKTKVYQFGGDANIDGTSGVYAKQGERDVIFISSKSPVETLSKGDIEDLLVYTVNARDVMALKLVGWSDVVGSPTTVELERKKDTKEWVVKGGAYEINQSAIGNFLLSTTVVKAERFVARKTGPKPEFGLDPAKGALEVTLTIEGREKPITLTVGATDTSGGFVHAMSSEAPGDVFLLLKAAFVEARSKPAAFKK